MIFYFSGTGNSSWVARQVANFLNDEIISISKELKKTDNVFHYFLEEDESIFFVFPVHSWGPAVLVTDFIQKMHFIGYKNHPVFAICSCGDDCGYTDAILRKVLRKKSLLLTRTFSIQMPNNYILMKGFDIDAEDIKNKKLQQASLTLENVVKSIQEGNPVENYTKGKFAFLKSYIVYPFFKKYAIGKNRFYAKDNCISCKLCVKVCPTHTISFDGIKPEWANDCVQCTACINRCPVKAIEYGKISVNKGRYHHPALKDVR